MSTVWIVKDKKRYNSATQQRESIYNFEAAKEFGELRFLLDDKDCILAQQPVINKLKRSLFEFKKEDSLLLVGDGALIAATAIIVIQINQRELPILFFDKFAAIYYRKILKL